MRMTVEIMLRGNNHVFTETIIHPTEPVAWTEDDVATILKAMLRATAKAQDPTALEPAEILLRGMNWIVHPSPEGGVVIALEIHSASAVAGPVPMAAATLEALIAKAFAAASRTGLVH
ncbi:MAG: hypothetical protein ABIT71_12555 [Vicinamibacteraceae bacterium]